MTPTPDPRQPAWDAVFGYIRTLTRDDLRVVERNAMIWRGVNAALVALGHPDDTDDTDLEGAATLRVDLDSVEPSIDLDVIKASRASRSWVPMTEKRLNEILAIESDDFNRVGEALREMANEVRWRQRFANETSQKLTELYTAQERVSELEEALFNIALTVSRTEAEIQRKSEQVTRMFNERSTVIQERDRLQTENNKLTRESAKLIALEQAGVDNWEGYDAAMAILRGEDPYE